MESSIRNTDDVLKAKRIAIPLQTIWRQKQRRCYGCNGVLKVASNTCETCYEEWLNTFGTTFNKDNVEWETFIMSCIRKNVNIL